MKTQWQKHIDAIDPMNGDCTLIDDEVLLWVENRLLTLESLLEEAAPHVFGSAGAEHMLDGFKPKRRSIDDLVEKIKAALNQ